MQGFVQKNLLKCMKLIKIMVLRAEEKRFRMSDFGFREDHDPSLARLPRLVRRGAGAGYRCPKWAATRSTRAQLLRPLIIFDQLLRDPVRHVGACPAELAALALLRGRPNH